MPGALEVGAEPEQRLSLAWGYAIRRRGAKRIEFVLKPSLLLQALVPTPLQFAGDQPVVGVDSVELPSCAASKRACSSASSNYRRFSASSRPRTCTAASAASTPSG
jgi:hypothetical protein